MVSASDTGTATTHDEQNYERGTAIADAIDQGDLPTAYVLSDVLQEVINYLRASAGDDVATETPDPLVESGGFSLTQTSKTDFNAGRSVFRRHDALSVTDAVSSRADVSERVIEKHYDERSESDKMEQRRGYLENI